MHVTIVVDIEPQVHTLVYGETCHQSVLVVHMGTQRANPIW